MYDSEIELRLCDFFFGDFARSEIFITFGISIGRRSIACEMNMVNSIAIIIDLSKHDL